MKRLILFSFVIFILSNMTGFAQIASANWALTTDGTPVVVGNVTASTLVPVPLTQGNSYFEGYVGSFFSATPAGFRFGEITDSLHWNADGTGATANSSLTGISTGRTQFMQFSITPVVGYSLTINNISLQAAQSKTAATHYIAAGYSTHGGSFTTFNSGGLSGAALSSTTGLFTTYSPSSPSITVSSGDTVIVRVVFWRKATSTAATTSDILANVVLSGTTTAVLTPSIVLSTTGPLNFVATSVGSSSGSQSFNIQGANLTSDIIVTPPAGFLIRTGANAFASTPITLTQAGGIVSLTQIDVNYTPVPLGSYSGIVLCSSSGATEQDVTVNAAGTFYSKSTGNLDALATWTTDPNGGAGTAPSNFTTPGQYFYIRNNATPTLGAIWTVSGTNSLVTVGDGTNPCVFTIPCLLHYSAQATEVTNHAALVLRDSASLSTLGYLTVDNGGTYQHDCNGGAQLTGAFLTGSTINITGVTTSNLWLPTSCYNVIWNCPAQTAAGKIYNVPGTFSVNGNMTIIAAGVSGVGTPYLGVTTGSDTRTLNIAGNLSIRGGSFRLLGASTGSGPTIVNVAGNVAVSDSGVLNLSSTTSATPTTPILNVQGNFLHTAGTVTKTSSTSGAVITFNGTLPQQFSTTGMAAAISFVINNPSGVTLETNVSLGGTITLTSGILTTGSDTLIISNNTTGAVTRTSGWVNGYLKRAFAASIGSYLFPLGDAAFYRGATVDFTGAPAKATNLTASFNGNDPGTNGLPSGISNYWHDGYWIVSSDTIPGGTYSISLDVNGISGVSSGDTKIMQRETSSDAWAVAGSFGDITSGVITHTGITGFSQFALGGDISPLPVELKSFTANALNRKVNLTWSTATETNFNKFVLERGTDKSTDWKVVGEVKGNGNSSTGHTYNLSDAGAVGNLKYRLHIIDNNGTGKYSQEILVKAGLPDHFQVYQNYPNPFNPSTVVAFDLPTDSYVKIELYSITGSKLADLSDGNQSAGFHNITISMNRYGMSSGIYFYKVNGFDLASKKSFLTVKKMVLMK